jgi:hypothetical protein
MSRKNSFLNKKVRRVERKQLKSFSKVRQKENIMKKIILNYPEHIWPHLGIVKRGFISIYELKAFDKKLCGEMDD